jgi:hypothetical protein
MACRLIPDLLLDGLEDPLDYAKNQLWLL